MPFWASIGVLSLTQGAVVALPCAWPAAALEQLRGRWWALIPAGSVAAFVAAGRLSAQVSADALTYLALAAVPGLAVLALARLMPRGARLGMALLASASLVGALFGLAWADRGGLAGQAAALSLSALSCVALGSALGAVAPARWLGLGILAMALVDASLVLADLLQAPNSALNAAHPAGGLPRLQAAIFGSGAMGYGDLFIAGVLGGLLAAHGPRDRQRLAAALVALLAVLFDLLFFWVQELPATVPVATGLLVLLAVERWTPIRWRRSGQREGSAAESAPPRRPARSAFPR